MHVTFVQKLSIESSVSVQAVDFFSLTIFASQVCPKLSNFFWQLEVQKWVGDIDSIEQKLRVISADL